MAAPRRRSARTRLAAGVSGRAPAPARRDGARIGLALAGGGPLGAIYEIGALAALDESLTGIDFTALDGYVGVSAGGFIAAALANGIGPRDLCRSFIVNDGPARDVFDPAAMMQPAWGEFASRLARVPRLAAQATWQIVRGRPRMAALEQLGSAMPAGLLDSERIHHELQRVFDAPGRSNDFRQLRHKLVLVATDLDSGAAAPFGQPGFDHVPISRAVQASAALPGLFPPVEIDGRCYVDGALKKTLHASVLLDEGLDLLICLNPLVPFDSAETAATPGRRAAKGIPRLVEGGLPVVLSQTFRSMIHSRLELGMKRYEHTHPGTDIVLFEPDHRDARMFLANTFSYSQRRELAEHAYQSTRALLRRQHDTLAPKLARHGIGIDRAVLFDSTRELVATEVDRLVRTGRALQRLDEALDDLERRLPRT